MATIDEILLQEMLATENLVMQSSSWIHVENNGSTEPRGGAGGSGGDAVIGKSNHD